MNSEIQPHWADQTYFKAVLGYILLDISKDGDSIAFLGSLIQCLTTLALSLFSIYPIRIFPVALCICWLSSFWHAFLRSGWLCLSLQIFADSSKICPQSSSGWTDSALSLYLSIQPLLTLVSCCWTHFSTSVSFLYWESSSWTQWICTIPQSVPVCGITPSRLRTLHLPLLSFMRFLPEVPGEEGEGRSVWIRRSLLQLPTGWIQVGAEVSVHYQSTWEYADTSSCCQRGATIVALAFLSPLQLELTFQTA